VEQKENLARPFSDVSSARQRIIQVMEGGDIAGGVRFHLENLTQQAGA
jgi:hypothetical protein